MSLSISHSTTSISLLWILLAFPRVWATTSLEAEGALIQWIIDNGGMVSWAIKLGHQIQFLTQSRHNFPPMSGRDFTKLQCLASNPNHSLTHVHLPANLASSMLPAPHTSLFSMSVYPCGQWHSMNCSNGAISGQCRCCLDQWGVPGDCSQQGHPKRGPHRSPPCGLDLCPATHSPSVWQRQQWQYDYCG